ncbi:cobW-domain-containing protein, partial [Hortaea werneckii]
SQENESVEEWLELSNGCICCSVKDQGVNALESLMDRKGTFDYILLETTGLADPGNIAPIFWVDDGLGSSIYLDGVVTLVDAKNVVKCLDEPVGEEAVHADDDGEQHGEGGEGHHAGPLLSTAHLQISHADVVVINKADLVTAAELEAVKERVRSINALARIQVTDHSQVPELEGLVLDLHAYDNVDAGALDFATKGHSHLDPAIGTMSLSLPSLNEKGLDRLDAWLRSVLWESSLPRHEDKKGWEIHRTKGRLVMSDGRTKMLQGVREIFELIDGADVQKDAHAESEEQGGRIVIIGRNVGGESIASTFQESLNRALS